MPAPRCLDDGVTKSPAFSWRQEPITKLTKSIARSKNYPVGAGEWLFRRSEHKGGTDGESYVVGSHGFLCPRHRAIRGVLSGYPGPTSQRPQSEGRRVHDGAGPFGRTP